MTAAHTDRYLPVEVTDADINFGGKAMQILPPYNSIPREFKSNSGNPWVEWQSEWFYKGLKGLPVPKDGIDQKLAMKNLACIQGSFSPKHEHKAAGVAYLASLWFSAPHAKASA